MKFETEKITLIEKEKNIKRIELPALTEEEKNIVDPLVAPTSGLRIQIYEKQEGPRDTVYILKKRKFFLFLRVFKAIAEKFKELHGRNNLKVLIVTDDRPSRKEMLNYSSQIFAHEGFEIYHQQDEPGESRVSSPYGAASVALYEDINLILVLTASHNSLSWNGVKFYIDYPIPMSGDLFKEISQLALQYKQIELKTDYWPHQIDAIKKNNDYVRDLLSEVIEIKSIRGKKIIIWPYLGKSEGIVNLFKQYGAEVVLIEETVNPPNPLKKVNEPKLQEIMEREGSTIALLLDADRDRIALYVKQNGKYYTYIPNEIYSAMHNILARDFNKQILNVRTVPSDLRGDETSFMNILTGVGYKHLGIILYFLVGVEVEQSKIDTAILYMEDQENNLIQIKEADIVKDQIIKLMAEKSLDNVQFIIVMWEESGGHTFNILNVQNQKDDGYRFECPFPLIADKYPVPALVLITELVCRGYVISEEIDFSIVGINRTIDAEDEEKIEIMRNFEENDGKQIEIGGKSYDVRALADNNGMIDIYQLKSEDSTIYFRPSGTGPNIRFYIFADRETYLEEIKAVEQYVEQNYK